MQDERMMETMMTDLIQYIMMPKLRPDKRVGTYVSYDIAAYDCMIHDVVAVSEDVTADRELALQIVSALNRYQLSPTHINEAISDMLSVT